MNYRHAFHAGSFADVAKHVALVLALRQLVAKDKPLAYLDLYAGRALYDLTSESSRRTGEAAYGVERLWPAPKGALGQALEPFLAALQAVNPDGRLRSYPGSPALAQQLLRPDDRLILNELQADEYAALRSWSRGDPRITLHRRDALEALPALVPPKEKRGLVLLDPAYEKPGEAGEIAKALARAYRRWPTGVYLIWYPIKTRDSAEEMLDLWRAAVPRSALVAELTVFEEERPFRLNGSGIFCLNPPWRYAQELATAFKLLQPLFLRDGGGFKVEELSPLTPPAKDKTP